MLCSVLILYGLDASHASLLHAICALASLYTPVITDIPPIDPEAGQVLAAAFNDAFVNRDVGDGESSGVRTRRKEGKGRPLDVFAKFDFATAHLQWCGLGLRIALRRGEGMLQQLQGE